MKKIIWLFILLNSILLHAQQNFINVPSSEVTPKNKLFAQQQFNFNEQIQSNTTLDYGLGKGFEIGLNILGLDFETKTTNFFINDTSDVDPYNPLIMINGLKQFEITKNINFSFGSQIGANFKDGKKTKEACLLYANLSFKNVLIKSSNLVIGSYYNSVHYGGKGNRAGAWVGVEIPLLKKTHFMAESIIGNNSISYTSIGFIYYPIPKLPVTLGVQIPNTKKNSYALVLEITFSPKS